MGQHRYDLDFTIVCIGLPMSGDTLPSGQALGGSETCAVQISEALARLGHRVTLFCNTEKPHEANDVIYMPMGWAGDRAGQSQFPKGYFDYVRSNPHDVSIVMRLPSLFQFEMHSKVNLLWQHDLATKTGPSQFVPFMWNIDRLLAISGFMKQQYQQVHGGPDKLYHVTRNGIDLKMIDAVKQDKPRDRFKLMFTARPERGLDILLNAVWPEILKQEPQAKLYLSRYQDAATLPLYNDLMQLAARYGDSIVNLGHLGKAQLYEHYKEARAYLYPSTFEETSCLTVNEVGACGGVFIGPWKAAVPETCGGSHILIRDNGQLGREGDPLDQGLKPPTQEFIRTFIEQAVSIMHDDDRFEDLTAKARKRAEQWTWDPVAEDWTDLCHRIIESRSSNPRRLVKHFLVNSDVVAAQKFAEQTEDKSIKKSVDRYIERFVPFMKEEDPQEQRTALANFYEQRSGGVTADYRTAFWADRELRLGMLLSWLKPRESEIHSLLDFGCAHGGYVRAISNTLPALNVLGVDVSPSLIRCANELKAAKLPDGSAAFLHPENVTFIAGDENLVVGQSHLKGCSAKYDVLALCNCGASQATAAGLFDCVIAMEVLEHLPHAEAVVERLERLCKPGGWMVFTVPYGHRERDEFVIKGVPPVHVRSFDAHDLMDIFGQRQDFQVTAFSDLEEHQLDRTFSGWYMACYRRDDKPLGQINWERKFFLQAPRETLAVCMITHNAEDSLHRCIKSVQKLADQVVILDNGPSTDKTIEIAQQYTDDLRAGTSPFYCRTHMGQHGPMDIAPGVCEMAGFESPRNESVQGVWADWIFWIDADENLVDFKNVWKYLRPNVYLGYAVNQHHLSVDPPGSLKKDIPVRLFRNNSGMRFYGLVHEHAELGINQGIGPDVAVMNDINIHHDGYLTEDIRRRRFHRNLQLLRCDRLKYPDRALGIYLYEVRDNMHLARYALERAGNRMTPEVQQHCQQVIDAYRKHFLGKDVILSQEGAAYYSDALAMLGLGYEICVDMDIKQVGAKLNGGASRFRVANPEEAKIVIEQMMRHKFTPFEGPYVA